MCAWYVKFCARIDHVFRRLIISMKKIVRWIVFAITPLNSMSARPVSPDGPAKKAHEKNCVSVTRRSRGWKDAAMQQHSTQLFGQTVYAIACRNEKWIQTSFNIWFSKTAILVSVKRKKERTTNCRWIIAEFVSKKQLNCSNLVININSLHICCLDEVLKTEQLQNAVQNVKSAN